MKVRISKKSTALTGYYGGRVWCIRAVISPITKNLFLLGTYDDERIEGFINRGYKRGTIVAYVIQCDGLARRDEYGLAHFLAIQFRFNGLRPSPKPRSKRCGK